MNEELVKLAFRMGYEQGLVDLQKQAADCQAPDKPVKETKPAVKQKAEVSTEQAKAPVKVPEISKLAYQLGIRAGIAKAAQAIQQAAPAIPASATPAAPASTVPAVVKKPAAPAAAAPTQKPLTAAKPGQSWSNSDFMNKVKELAGKGADWAQNTYVNNPNAVRNRWLTGGGVVGLLGLLALLRGRRNNG